MTTNVFDVANIRRKVERVRGRKAHLVGFEAVEIQRFVMASSRPIAIQGACEALKAFDEKNKTYPETIFAGGARGLMLIAADELETRIKELKANFKKATVGLEFSLTHRSHGVSQRCS